jgi:hypothetical protein
LPYKNPEKRRQFDREYKQKIRKAQGKISPLRAFKIYLCVRFPNLHLPGGTYFYNGFLITDDPTVQAQAERHPEFGRHIFPLALDLEPTWFPTED